MRSKALKLTAVAALVAPPAQALISCSCTYCLPNQGASCTYDDKVTVSCLSYVRNFCL